MNFKKYIKRFSLFFIIINDKLSINSKSINYENVNNLTLFIGPYRNLTTFLAAMFSLHPQLLVLNHAGTRVFKNKDINFLNNYSEIKFHTFINFFIHAIKKGYKGMRGGNIKYSHVFEKNEKLHQLLDKNKVDTNNKFSLVWKESHMVTNYFVENKNELITVLEKNQKINLLFPVRNPLDCASSTLNNNKSKYFKPENRNDIASIVKEIFDQYLFFLEIKKNYPNRILFFFENDFNSDKLSELCEFLKIEKSDEWNSFVKENLKITSSYKYSDKTIEMCVREIEKLFINYPEFKYKLLSVLKK